MQLSFAYKKHLEFTVLQAFDLNRRGYQRGIPKGGCEMKGSAVNRDRLNGSL